MAVDLFGHLSDLNRPREIPMTDTPKDKVIPTKTLITLLKSGEYNDVYPSGVVLMQTWCRLRQQAERITTLEAALLEAAYDVQDWGAYAGEYFQNKHDLAGTVKGIQDMATPEDKP